ncbi:YlbG family protein [Enterococcus sp. HY326]|uniref:YlbG family protein n=1 Tax=Enterococcus sp. HY326 TaxID=2971265 RepID=UPI003A0FEB5A
MPVENETHETIEIVEPKFEVQKRRGLIVWVYSFKQLKNLKRFGLVHYLSRRMKYVLLYVNEEEVTDIKERIEKLHFVRSVEPSYRPDVEMNFAEKIGTRAAYQMDDDEGFEVEELSTEIRLAEGV